MERKFPLLVVSQILLIFLPLCRAVSNAPLHKAVWEGDYATAASMSTPIDAFFTPFYRGWRLYLTALHLASIKGDVRMVEILLSRRNASVEVRDHLGFTPLLHAVWNGNYNVSRVLLHNGHAQVNAKVRYDRDGSGTPPSLNALHLLALKGPSDFLRDTMAEWGSAQSVPPFPDLYTLHGVYKEITKSMREYSSRNDTYNSGRRIQVELKTLTSLAPSEIARRENAYQQMVQLLLNESIDYVAPDRDGDSPIHMAAFMGNLKLINLLISYNASLAHLRTAYNATPLYNAVQGNQSAVVSRLLQQPGGIDVNVASRYRESNDSNSTPLIAAASGGFTEIASMLMDAGAKVDAKDILGNSPLLLAARRNSTAIARRILSERADLLNSTDKYHSTVLHNAVRGSSLEVVEELLSNWTSVDKPSVDIEALARYNDSRVPSFTPLLFAAIQGNVRIMRALVDKGANAMAVDGYGNKAIHLAACFSYNSGVEMVKFLLSINASINEPNVRNSMSPLHMAIICNSADYLLKLHRRGDVVLNLNVRARYPISPDDYFPKFAWWGPNDEDESVQPSATPLHYALYQHLPDVAMRLIKLGADVNARDRFNDTPLHIAVKASNEEANDGLSRQPSEALIRLLIAKGANGQLRNVQESTPLEVAYPLSVNDEIFRSLVHNDVDSGRRAIVVRNNANMVDHMLEVVCSALLTCDSEGKSALQLAIEHGRSAILLSLIKAGLRMDKLWCLKRHSRSRAVINARTETLTPLELAQSLKNIEIVDMIKFGLESNTTVATAGLRRLECQQFI